MLALILIWSAGCDESSEDGSGSQSSSKDSEVKNGAARYSVLESNENITCISKVEEYVSFETAQNCVAEPTYATDENGSMYYFTWDCLPAGYSKQNDQGYAFCSENETFTGTITGYPITEIDGVECISDIQVAFPHTYDGDLLYCGAALTYAMDENGSKYMFLSTCIGDGLESIGYEGYPYCEQ